MDDLRFPIGTFEAKASYSREEINAGIDAIETTPGRLGEAVSDLTEAQLDTIYRPGGWTVRQVVHHLPDSHVNSYVRFKLALTEEVPTIRPYHEDRWATLADSKAPIQLSLSLLEALHQRWVVLLRCLSDEDLARRFRHPEIGELEVTTNIALYAWHGNHHIAHITALRQRSGW